MNVSGMHREMVCLNTADDNDVPMGHDDRGHFSLTARAYQRASQNPVRCWSPEGTSYPNTPRVRPEDDTHADAHVDELTTTSLDVHHRPASAHIHESVTGHAIRRMVPAEDGVAP